MPGDGIKFYWPLDDLLYPKEATESLCDGRHVILYDEKDEEMLAIGREMEIRK